MAISKIILNGVTQIDLTQDTVTSAEHIMSSYVGHLADGTQVTGTGQGGASITEVQNTYGTEIVVTSGGGGGSTPSATRHTVHFEFTDETTEDIYVYYDSSFIGNTITATTPTTKDAKTVTLAQLDGITWYSYTPAPTPSEIPLNTQLIDYTKATNGYGIYSDGTVQETEWICVSDYTQIDPSMTFTVIGNIWYYTAFYDASKNLIDTLYNHDYLSEDNDTGTLSPSNIPAGSAWVRITGTGEPDPEGLSLIRTA